MRILHTSDWHIGKKLEGRSRIEEQRKVLYNISEIVREKGVDVVCVAGDVYDTYTPSAESERLFYDVVSDITRCGAQIVVISGNHDDPTRLTASKAISLEGGVYFAGAGVENSIVAREKEYRAKLVEIADDYFVFEKDCEKVYFAALPYPTELRMKEKIADDESYEDKVKRYVREAMRNCGDLPVVLIAHLFMLGGVSTEGERPIDLGGARILPPSIIPENCVYTALGHLHKRQVVSSSRNILYSGSIMQYSFDETGVEKSVTVFDVLDGAVNNLQVVKLDCYKNLYRVSAGGLDDAEEKVRGLDGFTEVSLTLDKPCGDEIKAFMAKYPYVSLKLSFSSVQTAVQGRKGLSDEELFKEYYASRYGGGPNEEVLSLYLNLINDIEVKNEA